MSGKPAIQPQLSREHVWKRLEVLLRLALAQLTSGRSGAETVSLVRDCADGLQMSDVTVVAAGRVVTVSYVVPPQESLTKVGVAPAIDAIDCDTMRRLELVADRIADGELQDDAALTAIDAAAVDARPALWPMVGLSVLALSVALQVGAEPLTAVLGAIVQLLTASVGGLLARIATPRMFVVTAQTITAAALAAAGSWFGLYSWTEAVVIVGVVWMLLVPQPMLVTAVIDAVNAEHLSAVSRAAGVIITVGGLALGGGIVLTVGDALRLSDPDGTSLPTLTLPLMLAFSAIGAMGNAVANRGDRGLLWRAALIGMGTAAVNLLLQAVGLGSGWSSTAAAVVLGFCAALWSRRIPYPAPALGLVGVTGALLPGLVVYQGVVDSLLTGDGLDQLATAGLINLGLGIGLALGIFLAGLVPTRRGR